MKKHFQKHMDTQHLNKYDRCSKSNNTLNSEVNFMKHITKDDRLKKWVHRDNMTHKKINWKTLL